LQATVSAEFKTISERAYSEFEPPETVLKIAWKWVPVNYFLKFVERLEKMNIQAVLCTAWIFIFSSPILLNHAENQGA
jgi:hypothetical protein